MPGPVRRFVLAVARSTPDRREMETYVYFAAAATVSRLLPISVGLHRWRLLDRAATLVVVFIMLSLLGDLGMMLLGRLGLRRNNLWVSHLLLALQTPVILLAFSYWARQAWLRKAMRLTALFSVAGWLLITLTLESSDRFARFTAPLQAALFCSAAIAILIQRGLGAEGPLSREGWFWTALAVLLLYGLTAVYRPLLDLFTTRDVTVIPAWTVLKALMVLQVIANLMFTRSLIYSRANSAIPVPAPA
jgi:hypothetical protein